MDVIFDNSFPDKADKKFGQFNEAAQECPIDFVQPNFLDPEPCVVYEIITGTTLVRSLRHIASSSQQTRPLCDTSEITVVYQTSVKSFAEQPGEDPGNKFPSFNSTQPAPPIVAPVINSTDITVKRYSGF